MLLKFFKLSEVSKAQSQRLFSSAVVASQTAGSLAVDNHKKEQWYLLNNSSSATEKKYLSPWHDLSIESDIPTPGEFTIKGVIEMSRGSQKVTRCAKGIEHNPITQQYCTLPDGETQLCNYDKPICFNYGFIPRTWSDTERGGDGDPLDLVDLSTSATKEKLSVGDFQVLGVLGLVHQGLLDYKIIVIDAAEAREREIFTLEDLQEQEQPRLDEVINWFHDAKDQQNEQTKLLWKGEVKDSELAEAIINEHRQWYETLVDFPEVMNEKQIFVPESSKI